MSNQNQQGDIAELASSTDVMELLECPICNEVPLPPIYTCQNGHTVCHSCLKKIDKCGLCQKPFTAARNYFMESLILSSKHYCRFRKLGCNELIRGDHLESHIQVCKFGNSEPKPKSFDNKEGSNSFVGCYQWCPSNKDAPISKNAVEGGIEHGNRLYIARCLFANSILPGKLNSGSRLLSFAYLGREINHSKYEILISVPDTLAWVTPENGQLPANAVIAGRTSIGEAVYVGRCGHRGTLSVGRVVSSEKLCRISYSGH